MNQINWDNNFIILRKSYEIYNCICLEFKEGYFRIDYKGFEKDDGRPPDFGKVTGIDFCGELQIE